MNMKMNAGLVVAEKVGDIDDKTREVKIRRISKNVVGCVQDVAGNIFFINFEDGDIKDLSDCLITVISDEQYVGKGREDIISDLPPKGEDELLIIDGDTVVEEGGIYGNGTVTKKIP